MSDNTGGPAFPCDGLFASDGSIVRGAGMQLRDYFAAKAMQGAIASLTLQEEFGLQRGPEWAYQIADAMLKERAK